MVYHQNWKLQKKKKQQQLVSAWSISHLCFALPEYGLHRVYGPTQEPCYFFVPSDAQRTSSGIGTSLRCRWQYDPVQVTVLKLKKQQFTVGMSTIEKKRLRWGYHKSSFFQQIHRVYNVILTYSFFSKLIKVVKKYKIIQITHILRYIICTRYIC